MKDGINNLQFIKESPLMEEMREGFLKLATLNSKAYTNNKIVDNFIGKIISIILVMVKNTFFKILFTLLLATLVVNTIIILYKKFLGKNNQKII